MPFGLMSFTSGGGGDPTGGGGGWSTGSGTTSGGTATTGTFSYSAPVTQSYVAPYTYNAPAQAQVQAPGASLFDLIFGRKQLGEGTYTPLDYPAMRFLERGEQLDKAALTKGPLANGSGIGPLVALGLLLFLLK